MSAVCLLGRTPEGLAQIRLHPHGLSRRVCEGRAGCLFVSRICFLCIAHVCDLEGRSAAGTTAAFTGCTTEATAVFTGCTTEATAVFTGSVAETTVAFTSYAAETSTAFTGCAAGRRSARTRNAYTRQERHRAGSGNRGNRA